MEFRFAHVTLRKPIVLAVVGTGFEWEGTEVKHPTYSMMYKSTAAIVVITCQQFAHKHIVGWDAEHILKKYGNLLTLGIIRH